MSSISTASIYLLSSDSNHQLSTFLSNITLSQILLKTTTADSNRFYHHLFHINIISALLQHHLFLNKVRQPTPSQSINSIETQLLFLHLCLNFGSSITETLISPIASSVHTSSESQPPQQQIPSISTFLPIIESASDPWIVLPSSSVTPEHQHLFSFTDFQWIPPSNSSSLSISLFLLISNTQKP